MKKYIDRALNHFGYYRFDMPKDTQLSEAEVLEMFRTYGDNKMFIRFLRDLMVNDVRIYFQAQNEDERQTIRGAYRRTNYFISLIQKANDKRKRNNS